MDKIITSSTSWLSDLLLEEIEIDGCDLFQQCDQNLFDDEDFLSHNIASVFQQEQNNNLQQQQQQQPLSSESYSSEKPNKKLKTKNTLQDNSHSPVSSPSSTTSQILCFDKSTSLSSPNTTTQFHAFDSTLNTKQNEVVPLSQTQQPLQNRKGSLKKQNFVESVNPQGHGTKRSAANNQEHIIAERRRREKLSQSLIALAALIPGLKKMDKASVLGDAIKYVKELQERLRRLEEKNKNTTSPVESVVTVNKSQQSYESSSDDDETEGGSSEKLPHVEVRVLDNDVLLRIHCQKQKGLLLKILEEIHNLHLFVVNSSVLPFGDSIIDITIVAKMGTGYKVRKDELMSKLRVAALVSIMS